VIFRAGAHWSRPEINEQISQRSVRSVLRRTAGEARGGRIVRYAPGRATCPAGMDRRRYRSFIFARRHSGWQAGRERLEAVRGSAGIQIQSCEAALRMSGLAMRVGYPRCVRMCRGITSGWAGRHGRASGGQLLDRATAGIPAECPISGAIGAVSLSWMLCGRSTPGAEGL
jgi:hypothetical protein